ncbi:MAG: endonuclease YncB(thermonuclease family) [Oceanicoccus sp.]|jgi:endonuclease YncB( thermonuclease family)
MMKLRKSVYSEMIRRFFLLSKVAFFVLLFSAHIHLAAAESYVCSAKVELRWERLSEVIDGDTIRLTGGEKLRVIAINAPELGGGSRPAQAFSRQAKAAVVEFFGVSEKVGVQAGLDQRDRYGRLLAHVYRHDGVNLSEYLLGRGLAMQILVPPNDAHWRCLEKVEVAARNARLGVWQHPQYQPKSAASLQLSDSGFQRIEGTVNSVVRSGKGWWLEVGKLAVRIVDRDMRYFPGVVPGEWRGQKIRLRGWVINRSGSAAVKNKGYAALMMNLRHPVMMN